MTHDKKRLLSIGEAAKALEVTRRMILNYVLFCRIRETVSMETVTIQQTPSRASGASAFCRISVCRWMISMPIITARRIWSR